MAASSLKNCGSEEAIAEFNRLLPALKDRIKTMTKTEIKQYLKEVDEGIDNSINKIAEFKLAAKLWRKIKSVLERSITK